MARTVYLTFDLAMKKKLDQGCQSGSTTYNSMYKKTLASQTEQIMLSDML